MLVEASVFGLLAVAMQGLVVVEADRCQLLPMILPCGNTLWLWVDVVVKFNGCHGMVFE